MSVQAMSKIFVVQSCHPTESYKFWFVVSSVFSDFNFDSSFDLTHWDKKILLDDGHILFLHQGAYKVYTHFALICI